MVRKIVSIQSLLAFLLCAIQAMSQNYVPQQTVWGTRNFVEYFVGELPLIITSPHGGNLNPSDLPDRKCADCVTVTDANTIDLSNQIKESLFKLTGRYPHLIVNHLERIKMDANRDVQEAALGNPDAIKAWNEFHGFVNYAKNQTQTKYGKGLLIDIHGHAHTLQRLELGYLLSKTELQLPDPSLNNKVGEASIKSLAQNNPNQYSLVSLLKGNNSLGTMLEIAKYPSVPSAQQPFPKGDELYFNGGYITDRHGSKNGGTIDAIQFECNFSKVRETTTTRRQFADSLAKVLFRFMEKHYFLDFKNRFFVTSIANKNAQNTALEVFPNPFEDEITVALYQLPTPSTTLKLVDNTGKLFYNFEVKSHSQIKIKIPANQHFMYLILANEQQSISTKKLIRIH